jgi:hypothetical protein
MSRNFFALPTLLVGLGCLTAQAALAANQPHVRRHYGAEAHHIFAHPIIPLGPYWANWTHSGYAHPASVSTYDPACGLPSSACPNNKRNSD